MENSEKITDDNVKSENNNEQFTSDSVKGEANNNVTSEENTNDNVKTSREISNETGTKNLIPLTERSKEEQKRIRALGGIKSGEARRARKTASELLTKILTTNLTDEQIEEVLGNASTLLNGDKTSYNVMLVKALQMAMSGDTKALQFVRDSVGDMPTSKQEIQAQISDADKQLIDTVRNRLLG